MSPDDLRMIERIIIALFGGMSVYLGYRLFISVPFAKTGSGRFEFPKFGKIALSHIGPGVFFALFGAAVLVTGLLQTTKSETRSSQDSIFAPILVDGSQIRAIAELEAFAVAIAPTIDAKSAENLQRIIAKIKSVGSRREQFEKREAKGPEAPTT